MTECPSFNLLATLQGDRRNGTGLCKNLGGPTLLFVAIGRTTSTRAEGGGVSIIGSVKDPSSNIFGLCTIGACTTTGPFLADELK